MSNKRFPLSVDLASFIYAGRVAGTLSNDDLRHQVALGRFPLKSATRHDSVVVTSTIFVAGSPLLGAIVLDTTDAYMKPNMHWMSSAYPKDNHAKLVEWEEKGLLLWRR